ncbi:putative septin-7 isoform X1 [Daphnia sinensis]|uniref:Septin-7 isoform X1 n=1 Tax=Daphnia sinensis TaxID=1820382 RepID=A0AAD5L3A8_9CRUS|nr:putative septin-7 isoform X1 [Daphnia sinensis]
MTSEQTAMISSEGTAAASRRERLRRPLPNPPEPNRGSTNAAAAAAAAGVRGVVASRLAAMASAGSPISSVTSSSSSAALSSSTFAAATTTTTTTNGTSSNSSDNGLPHKLTTSYSVDSNSRIPSYRLSSLDRLAQRQRLFEATTATSVQPNGLPTAHPPPPPSSSSSSSSTFSSATNVATGETHALQSKREMFFKSETLPAGASLAGSNSASTTNSTGATPASSATGAQQPVGNIASLKESLLANKENHTTTTMAGGPQTSSSSTTLTGSISNNSSHGSVPGLANNSTGSKVEALKRELTDDSGSSRVVLRDRLAEKGPAPSPPVINKTREVDYVGFANLPNQVYRRAVKKGFEFTLMVVGESGLGKSTLINSMFLADIYSPEYPGPSHRIKKTVQVEQCQTLLKENGVNLTLTVVDTPGFGDAVDNSNCWQPIVDYIESKYEEYLNAESRVQRQPMRDHRVHVCLYFIQPSGHGLKPLDIEFMKRLHDKVNIIPVLAKADTMTPDECTYFKKQVLNEIAQHKIKIYEFPDVDDEELRKSQRALRERVPFAVVGSNTVVEVDGRKIRGRRYPWGVVEVENMEHCDFIALRNMLIRTHMTDLKEVTNNVHYENFRCRKLAGVGVAANDGTLGKSNRISNKNPLAQMEEERRDHEAKMKKMEQEMEQVFEMKVKEKTQKLKDSETDLQRRHEQTLRSLEAQKLELEEKRKAFENEKMAWENASGLTLEELRRRSLEANSREVLSSADEPKRSISGAAIRFKRSLSLRTASKPETYSQQQPAANQECKQQ